LPDHYTDLHKNPSLFDLCINISNKVILALVVLLFVFIVFMCSLFSTPTVLICILMCVCRILIKITYLLIYYVTRMNIQINRYIVTVFSNIFQKYREHIISHLVS